MSIATDLEAKSAERLIVWRFISGISVICIETFEAHGEKLGEAGRVYVANEYLPEMDYLSIPALKGYVAARRFKLRCYVAPRRFKLR